MSDQEIKFNVNHYVKVKLTDRGRNLLRAKHDSLPELGKYTPPEEDAEGWSKWQLWDLMAALGEHSYMGPPPPFETEIIICVKEATPHETAPE